MKIIKKINNNVAIGLDGKGKEVVIIGKGIGFGQIPYELTDLSLITRTFYDIESKYYGLLDEIPEEIFMMVSRLLDYVKSKMDTELKPTLTFVLADHVNFAIERYHKGIDAGLPYSYEMEYEYPDLTELAKWFIEQINRQMKIHLSKGEITSITVHLLNAMDVKEKKNADLSINVEEIIDGITKIVESHFDKEINRESFSYFRFKNHIKFYVQRKTKGNEFTDNGQELYLSMRDTYPELADCVDRMDYYLEEKFGEKCPKEELMYLMIHVIQLYNKDINADTTKA